MNEKEKDNGEIGNRGGGGVTGRVRRAIKVSGPLSSFLKRSGLRYAAFVPFHVMGRRFARRSKHIS